MIRTTIRRVVTTEFEIFKQDEGEGAFISVSDKRASEFIAGFMYQDGSWGHATISMTRLPDGDTQDWLLAQVNELYPNG